MAVGSLSLLDDAEDVVLAQNQMLFTVDLHFGARVLAEEHDVAGLHVELADFSILANLAVADGNDLALDGLLFCTVGDEDDALLLFLFLDSPDYQAFLLRAV